MCIKIGLYDMVQYAIDYPEWVKEFAYALGDCNTDSWKNASPQYIKETTVKEISYLIVHAPGDKYVPTVQAKNFEQHLSKHLNILNVELMVDFSDDLNHYTLLERVGTEKDPLTALLLKWIAKLKK
eukprot:TRINITY_DN7290_c0_g1_i1.p1 TRINITY_DN7290_c0_g1~~TRINITY_DN7290_c0_g1_i1.p1  ORF type:complete len:126 (-),score=22.25 TRINITY_DN7290_c0_g1_i1:76-453(-)